MYIHVHVCIYIIYYTCIPYIYILVYVGNFIERVRTELADLSQEDEELFDVYPNLESGTIVVKVDIQPNPDILPVRRKATSSLTPRAMFIAIDEAWRKGQLNHYDTLVYIKSLKCDCGECLKYIYIYICFFFICYSGVEMIMT